MSVTKKEIEPIIGLVEMGYNSLWFLTQALQKKNHRRTIGKLFKETIGTVPAGATSVFNQGTCLLAGYLLFVVPKEAHFKEFANHVLCASSLDMEKFTLTDGSSNPWNKTLPETLNKLRNGIAHANVAVDPGTTCLHLWDHPQNSKTINFHARVELTDFIAFCEGYHAEWIKWAELLN